MLRQNSIHFKIITLFPVSQLTTDTVGNIRTVAALTLEEKFINQYEQLTRVPYR